MARIVMSQSSQLPAHQRNPRSHERSEELLRLLAHCPEHLFSTDDNELAPIDTTTDADEEGDLKQSAARAA